MRSDAACGAYVRSRHKRLRRLACRERCVYRLRSCAQTPTHVIRRDCGLQGGLRRPPYPAIIEEASRQGKSAFPQLQSAQTPRALRAPSRETAPACERGSCSDTAKLRRRGDHKTSIRATSPHPAIAETSASCTSDASIGVKGSGSGMTTRSRTRPPRALRARNGEGRHSPVARATTPPAPTALRRSCASSPPHSLTHAGIFSNRT